MSATLSFSAILLEDDGTTATMVQIPFSVPEAFGRKGQVRVRGTINGLLFRSSMAPYGGVHYMMVIKKLRDEIGVKAGDVLQITLEEDLEERVVDVPEDLEKALSVSPLAQKNFGEFSYTTRKEYVGWLNNAKRQETRSKRLGEIVSRAERKLRFGQKV